MAFKFGEGDLRLEIFSIFLGMFVFKSYGMPTHQILKFSVGNYVNCVIFTNGKVKCWGYNGQGQLGLGDTRHRGGQSGDMGSHLPYVVLDEPAIDIQNHGWHTCVLLKSRRVKCWGANTSGQLGQEHKDALGGTPTTIVSKIPPINLGGQKVKSLASGYGHTCVITMVNEVKCWGRNNRGQLGMGDGRNRGDRPGTMGAQLNSVDLGKGLFAVDLQAKGDLTCAHLNDGTIKCWGYNRHGALGQGHSNNIGDEPNEMGDNLPSIQLDSNSEVERLYVGGFRNCAKLKNGKIKCWGFNGSGYLGLGDTESRGDEPHEMGTALPELNLGESLSTTDVKCLGTHCCALFENNAVKCWGLNREGGLGLNDIMSRGDNPTEMGDDLAFIDFGKFVTVRKIYVGNYYSCANLSNDTFRCWGYNHFGQLGLGDRTNRGHSQEASVKGIPPIQLF